MRDPIAILLWSHRSHRDKARNSLSLKLKPCSLRMLHISNPKIQIRMDNVQYENVCILSSLDALNNADAYDNTEEIWSKEILF